MRAGNILFSIVNLLFAVFLLAFGLFIFTIPYAPHFRHQFILFFQENLYELKIIGLLLFLLGLFLLITFYLLHRRSSLTFKMGASSTALIDNQIVQKYVKNYFQSLFPGKEVEIHTTNSRGKITIVAGLPEVPYEEQRSLLEKVEEDLQALFERYLGYKAPFFFTVTFRT